MRKLDILKLLALILCAALLVGLCGCHETGDEPTSAPTGTFAPSAEATEPTTTEPADTPLQFGGNTFTLDGEIFEMGASPQALINHLGRPKNAYFIPDQTFGVPMGVYEYDHLYFETFQAQGIVDEMLVAIYFLDNHYVFDGVSVGDTAEKLDNTVSARLTPQWEVLPTDSSMGGPAYEYDQEDDDYIAWYVRFPGVGDMDMEEVIDNTYVLDKAKTIRDISIRYGYVKKFMPQYDAISKTAPDSDAFPARITGRFDILTLPAAGTRSVDDDYRYTTLPDGTVEITKYTGYGGNVTIPAAIGDKPVTSIGDCAFLSYMTLTGVVIPDSVTSIGDSAFSGCVSLQSVTIPNSVASIGKGAFSECDALQNVTIPNSVTSIGDNAFSKCGALTAIVVANGNTAYTAVDGVLFNKDKTTLMCYPCGKTATQYGIPDSVRTIAPGAFERNGVLQEVTFPRGDTMTVGDSAFFGCQALRRVRIQGGDVNVNAYAFAQCPSLTNVVVDGKKTGLGNSAFRGCHALVSAYVGWDSTFSLGDDVFRDCEKLTVYGPRETSAAGQYAQWGVPYVVAPGAA